jgi:hypothetical protein
MSLFTIADDRKSSRRVKSSVRIRNEGAFCDSPGNGGGCELPKPIPFTRQWMDVFSCLDSIFVQSVVTALWLRGDNKPGTVVVDEMCVGFILLVTELPGFAKGRFWVWW